LVGLSERIDGKPHDDPNTETEGRVMDFETLLRCLGYSIDAAFKFGPVAIAAVITWRLAR
jgi:hypothetical protein